MTGKERGQDKNTEIWISQEQKELFCLLLGKFAGPLMKVVVPLGKNILASLATMASASAIDDAIQREMHGRGVIATWAVGVVRAGKGITLFISKEGMDEIIRIIKSLEHLGALIGGVSKKAKHEIKTTMLRNMLTGKSVMRAGKGVVKVFVRAEREYNNMDRMD